MNSMTDPTWDRFKKYFLPLPELSMSLDISKMRFDESELTAVKTRLKVSFEKMSELEAGAIANPDENRMVGHYWLRAPDLAPDEEIRNTIIETNRRLIRFVRDVHEGTISGANGSFKNVILVGIGGSALGPQFIHQALGHGPEDKMRIAFFDNTDPDGMDGVIAQLGDELGLTLTVTISKSGGTKETRNGMLEAKRAYEKAGLDFSKHAIAVTGEDSELGRFAEDNGWLDQFPMWDWVGGRTSVMSAVGLLPAALQGVDIEAFLDGAKVADSLTRLVDFDKNPAAQLAAMWYLAGNGRGDLAMVVLPYKDRLELFSKYLQQLVMESIGKRSDLDGNEVFQGLSVYGNKGSTDQHAYVQQLRDGLNNFFVTFIEVLKDRSGQDFEVEPLVTAGDYLSGFFQGTRRALYDSDRQSITLTVNEISAFSVGALIALYERAVGLYANLVNINAYHQPGVEAGKKAAGEVIKIQRALLEFFCENGGQMFHVEQIAERLQSGPEIETVFKVLEHLAANSRISKTFEINEPFAAKYGVL